MIPLKTPLLAACLVLGASRATASDLAVPTGEVILTVSGAIGATNADAAAVFDLAMLRSLPQTTYETTTIWTEGPQVFTGVLLDDLMQALEARGHALQATAINDYAVEIPMTDAADGAAMVAYLANGAPMSVRDKGPLWIVYPYDSDPAFQSEVIYSRSIWQLDRLSVQD